MLLYYIPCHANTCKDVVLARNQYASCRCLTLHDAIFCNQHVTKTTCLSLSSNAILWLKCFCQNICCSLLLQRFVDLHLLAFSSAFAWHCITFASTVFALLSLHFWLPTTISPFHLVISRRGLHTIPLSIEIIWNIFLHTTT